MQSAAAPAVAHVTPAGVAAGRHWHVQLCHQPLAYLSWLQRATVSADKSYTHQMALQCMALLMMSVLACWSVKCCSH